VAAATEQQADDERPLKRGKYDNWFASPFIHDILQAYELVGRSAKKTVAYLQRAFPRLPTEAEARFAGLSESTLRSWFDKDHHLLTKFQAILDEQRSVASRGIKAQGMFAGREQLENEIKRVLQVMRDRGAVVNVLVIRLVMKAMIESTQPALLAEFNLSKSFVSKWAREALGYTWRVRTTAASKLPLDWRSQGILMAKRIAVFMQLYKVDPSLVVNVDQTGVHLAPVDLRTYEAKGSKVVKVIGADDKRQITCCIASSLDGDLLPLQLIFEGKTAASEPKHTEESKAAHIHLTHSPNHWSSQETMRQWIDHVLLPYSERQMQQRNLRADSHIILVLDVWSVHISEEFRFFLRGEKYQHIHLVYVPPNCTSHLQVADVMQRPFKHGIRREFNEWAAALIKEQIEQNDLAGLSPFLRMSVIKPKIVEWCLASWRKMTTGRD
jgi:hypothetical protein